MKIKISNLVHVTGIPKTIDKEIRKRLTLKNPAYIDAIKMNRWTAGIEPKLSLYDQPEPGTLITPRGFINQLCTMAKKHNIHFTWEDKTRKLPPVDFEFKGKLRDYQEQAAMDVLRRRFEVVQAPTGSGKTIVALNIIAKRGQPVLIIVHTKELLNQWIARIESFLKIPKEEIGIIGSGTMRIGNRVTVAMVQSLYKCANEVSPHIGHVVVDECHRTPSRTFTEAISAFDSKYMLGLSATPFRRDRLTKLIYLHLGDQASAIDQKDLTDNGDILPFKVKWVKTHFTTTLDPSNEYSKMLSELTQDSGRNRLVCQEAAQQANNGGGIPLVLSDRKAHCTAIAEALDRDHGIKAMILTGNLSGKQRENVVGHLRAGKCQALVATGQLIGEGFDLPALGSVLLTTPIAFKGRVIQSIGRTLRPSPGQCMATVIDFVDGNIPVLKNSAKKRLEIYRDMGAGGC